MNIPCSCASRSVFSKSRPCAEQPARQEQRLASTTSPASTRKGSQQEPLRNYDRAYLGGLDGLRAIAALAVLLYHSAPMLIPGGFLGVDVFFVLSGFLISSLLLSDCSRYGKIRIGHFWLKRWRRLFPAVAAVATITAPLAALISPNLIARFPSQLAGTLTFSYNWVSIATGHSYFDRMSPKLLTNMWTLSVEQQFYLLWPFVISLLWLLRRAIRPWIALALAAGSATLMAIYTHGGADLSRAYMGTDSHAFGLMIGAALALFFVNPLAARQRPYRGYARNYAGLLGIGAFATLILLFLHVSDSSPHVYPGITVAASLCSAVIIFAMSVPIQGKTSLATLLRAVLDTPILHWLGVRSYGIYLWHWPLLVIWRYLFPHAHVATSSIVIASSSILAAALSYRYVEEPMRRNGIIATLKKWVKAHTIITSAILLMALVGLIVCTAIAPKYSQIERALGLGGADSSPSAQQRNQHTGTSKNPADTTGADHSQQHESASDQRSAPRHKPEAEVQGENITIVGDSVMLAISQKAQEQWPGAIIDGEVSRSYYAMSPLIQQYDSQGNLRHFVVIGAANNGPLPSEKIEEWLGLIGSERVLILVTGHGNAYTPWIAESNNAIYAAQKAHPDQIVVADWFSMAEKNPQWLYEDLTHPNTEGIPQFISLLQDALDQAGKLPNAYEAPPTSGSGTAR